MDAKPLLNNKGGSYIAQTPIAGGPWKCLVSERREMALNTGQSGITTSVADFKIKFKPGTPVKVGNRVQVLCKDGSNGGLFNVIGINSGETDRLQIVVDAKLIV